MVLELCIDLEQEIVVLRDLLLMIENLVTLFDHEVQHEHDDTEIKILLELFEVRLHMMALRSKVESNILIHQMEEENENKGKVKDSD